MYRTLFFLMFLLFSFYVPLVVGAEEGQVVVKGQSVPEGVAIGDPREIFLKRLPPKKQGNDKESTKKSPQSLAETFDALEKEFKKVGEDLRLATKEIASVRKKTFHDSDFIPPERPDWR